VHLVCLLFTSPFRWLSFCYNVKFASKLTPSNGACSFVHLIFSYCNLCVAAYHKLLLVNNGTQTNGAPSTDVNSISLCAIKIVKLPRVQGTLGTRLWHHQHHLCRSSKNLAGLMSTEVVAKHNQIMVVEARLAFALASSTVVKPLKRVPRSNHPLVNTRFRYRVSDLRSQSAEMIWDDIVSNHNRYRTGSNFVIVFSDFLDGRRWHSTFQLMRSNIT